MPPCTVPPFGAWKVSGEGVEEILHGVVVVVHERGVEVYDLAGTNASKSCCEQLRKRGIAVTLHTSPSHCN